MQKKRINLFNKFRDSATSLADFDRKYPDFTAWEKINFKDSSSVEIIWNKSLKGKDVLGNVLWGDDLKTFYSTFVCSDQDWAKSTSFCGGSTQQGGGSTQQGGGSTQQGGGSTQQGGGTSTSFGTDTNITVDQIKGGAFVKYGMKGDIVGKIQEKLKKHGKTNFSTSGNIDKIFGSKTKNMVKEFQRSKGLKDDGVVGPKTWAELEKEPSTNPVTPVTPITPIGPKVPDITPEEVTNNNGV